MQTERNYTIWITFEDDFTMDVCVWDEDLNERAENLEQGHIPCYALAVTILNQIIDDNPDICFTILPDAYAANAAIEGERVDDGMGMSAGGSDQERRETEEESGRQCPGYQSGGLRI